MEENEIKIGKQTWTTKNLDLSTYSNGEAIPQVQDANAWTNLTTGAWCYYENESDNGSTYGKLYNWYAVNDPRGLAPKGYHIPSDLEWTILIDNIGDEAGTKMKSTSNWERYEVYLENLTPLPEDEDGNGTNTSGFAGLPGGFCSSYGIFNQIGANGYWWSSSEDLLFNNNGNVHNIDNAFFRLLFNTNGNVYRDSYNKPNGFSVRCIKD